MKNKIMLTAAFGCVALSLIACGDDSSNPSNNGGISEQDIIIKTACGNIYSDMTFRNEGGDVLGIFNRSNKNIVLIDESVYNLTKTEILEGGSYACPIKESVLDSLGEIINKKSSSSNKVGSSSSENELSSSSQKAVSSSGAIVSKPSWQDMNPDIEYGLFMDERDGQYYRTVQIGDQVWMAENLNYESEESFCYDETTNCDKYGRLYTWRVVKHVCPAGYHLPSDAEWDVLLKFVLADNNLGITNKAGTYLKSKTGWLSYNGIPAGNDKYGFSVLPAGGRYSDGSYYLMGNSGNFWSSTELSSTIAYYYYYYLSSDRENLDRSISDRGCAWSVRCVKD